MNKLISKLVSTLFYVYFTGFIISAIFFNWQYAQKNSFSKWLLFGEIVPTIQGTVWPYYAAKYFDTKKSSSLHEGVQQQKAQLPSDDQIITSFKEKAWWLPEYSQLNTILDKSGGFLSTSYRVGQNGDERVGVTLERGAEKGLNLVLNFPPQAMVNSDPKTGENIPYKERVTMTFRDHDLDGIPDDVFSNSFKKSIPKDMFTADGFLQIRNNGYLAKFLTPWTIGLAFSANHFLHDRDSVLQ